MVVLKIGLCKIFWENGFRKTEVGVVEFYIKQQSFTPIYYQSEKNRFIVFSQILILVFIFSRQWK